MDPLFHSTVLKVFRESKATDHHKTYIDMPHAFTLLQMELRITSFVLDSSVNIKHLRVNVQTCNGRMLDA